MMPNPFDRYRWPGLSPAPQPPPEPLLRCPLGRRRAALMRGEFDAPCAVCGATPTVLLVEWYRRSPMFLDDGGKDGDGAASGFAAGFEWQYFYRDHVHAATHDCCPD